MSQNEQQIIIFHRFLKAPDLRKYDLVSRWFSGENGLGWAAFLRRRAQKTAWKEEPFCIIVFPPKAPFNVASHSASAFPAPLRAASLPRRGQCRDTQPAGAPLPVLGLGVPARGSLRGREGAAPPGRVGQRMLRHPAPASSHRPAPPRLRPAPGSPLPPAPLPPSPGPLPCPAGDRPARKPLFSVNDTHIDVVLRRGPLSSLPRSRRTRAATP